MKKLWAPWRFEYIKNVDNKKEGCIFCSCPKDSNDRENLILYKGEHNFVIINKFPYNNGHLMVVPYIHTSDTANLDGNTVLEMWDLLNISKNILINAMHPEGFNIGMNVGRPAGAGIDTHLHVHIVPRWNGDTNFMPVLGGVKILSQSLMDTYDVLYPYFHDIEKRYE